MLTIIAFTECAATETTTVGEKDTDTDSDTDTDGDTDTDSDTDTDTDSDTDTDTETDTGTFMFRKLIPITAGAGAGTDFQVKVMVGESSNASGYDVHANGKCTFDFSDIRFTDDDGQTLLGHWIESTFGTTPDQTVTYWVKVNDDLDSDREIFLYYGNSFVDSASDGEQAFAFFDGFEYDFDTSQTALSNAATYQTTPTYDGSGQAIHPDIAYFPTAWNGYQYWMAMTPYPGGNDQIENPSILVSNDGSSWSVPVGLTNPLIGAPACDHNNDTDIIYNQATDELWVYYLDTRRASQCGGHSSQPYYNHNFLKLFKSSDGVSWTGPTTVIDWDLSVEPLQLSPSVVYFDATHFYLWVSNGSDTVTRYESSDGESWTSPQVVTLAENVWHLDVSYIPSASEYWMLSMYPSVGGSMRWAVSSDGLSWTSYTGGLVMDSGSGGWDENLYRGCFLYDDAADLLEVWYSAYNAGTVWHTGYTSSTYTSFIASLGGSGAWSVYDIGGSWSNSADQIKRGMYSGKLEQTSAVGGEKMIVYKSQPLSNNLILEWDMYDDLDTTAMKLVRLNAGSLGQQTGLGVWTGNSSVDYSYHSTGYVYTTASATRTVGWSKFGIAMADDASMTFFIDDVSIGSLTGQFSSALSVSVEGYDGGPSIFYIDDVRIRKRASIEPVLGTPGDEEEGFWNIY